MFNVALNHSVKSPCPAGSCSRPYTPSASATAAPASPAQSSAALARPVSVVVPDGRSIGRFNATSVEDASIRSRGVRLWAALTGGVRWCGGRHVLPFASKSTLDEAVDSTSAKSSSSRCEHFDLVIESQLQTTYCSWKRAMERPDAFRKFADLNDKETDRLLDEKRNKATLKRR